MIQTALAQLLAHADLSAETMHAALTEIMRGEATPAQIAGFLIALAMKGETVTEMVSAAHTLRHFAIPVAIPSTGAIDIVGTGGDRAKTFNISTAAAFVAAASGAPVAKHHAKSSSSLSGSADVLALAGITPLTEPAEIIACFERFNLCFMYAPNHHQALHYTVSPRRELGCRTFFNLLGPLLNPGNVKRQVIGLFAKQWLLPITEVLQALGSRHSLVVHSEDGLDEISLCAQTHVCELRNHQITEFTIAPEDFNLKRTQLSELQVANSAESLVCLRSVFANEAGPKRDVVALNAGAALYVAGLALDIKTGVQQALAILASGRVAKLFDDFCHYFILRQTNSELGPAVRPQDDT